MADDSLKNYYSNLRELLSYTSNDPSLFEVIVNGPFHNKFHTTHIDLGIVVLLLVNNKKGTIQRIALSDTEPARWAVKMTPVAFKEIIIPVDDKENAVATAIRTQKPQYVTDWDKLFTPALSPEAARFNQAGAGIACSFVYPLTARDGGALIYSFYQPPDEIGPKHKDFMLKYAKLANKALKPKS